MISRNQQLFERAQRHIPVGVNSTRARFFLVAAFPASSRRPGGASTGCRRKWYTDYVVGSWGLMILGRLS